MMTDSALARGAAIVRIGVATLVMGACASTQFDQAIESHRWSDAASAVSADTSLLDNESGLFQSAMLYSFPIRGTYDPARARELFERLLQRYPATTRRQAAIDQLSLLYELQRTDNALVARQQILESKIAQLAADTSQLRTSIDSVAARLVAEQDQSALLRKVTTRMEGDLQDRENQLNVLHSELNHLKAIDLQPVLRLQGDRSVKKPGN
jgi:hypothetical protein